MSASASSPSARAAWRLPAGVLVIAALAVALALAQMLGSGVWVGLIARIAIFGLAALSLSFILGQGGMTSFGQAAPMGIGAYACLLLGQYDITDLATHMAAAFVGAAMFCALTGAIALRTRGVYFIMITLAFAQMAYFSLSSLALFGGDDGMPLAVGPTLFGLKLRGAFPLAALALAVLAACLYGAQRITRSRFGMILRGAKDNEARISALGYAPFRFRLIAYSLAGGIAGIAGVFLANMSDFVSPSYLNWHRSGELLIMVVLGGPNRLAGSIVGAALLVLVEEGFGAFTDYWRLGLGVLIVAVAMLRGADMRALLRGGRHD